MKKYISFADSVRALAITAVTSEITPEHVRALAILDPEFKNAVEDLHTLFANSIFEDKPTLEPVTTATSFTDSQDEDNHSKEEKKPVVKKRTSSKKKTSKKKASSKKEKSHELTDIPEGFFVHPEFGHIYANKEGEIIISNKMVMPHMSGGYMRVHVGNGKYVNAARIVYECCTGKLINDKECIKYKNDNRKDVSFNNLYITKHRGGYGPFSDADVVEISEKVVYYANQNLSINQIIEKTVNDLSVSINGVRSVLAGNYSKISGKYFYVGPGKKVIPVSNNKTPEKSETSETTPVETTKATETTETPKTTEETKTEEKLQTSPCIEVLNKGLQAGINAFDSKYLRGEELTKADMIIPVIRYMYNTDGSMRDNKEINTLISKEYGPEIVPDITFIMDVKQGRFGKNVLEAAFRK